MSNFIATASHNGVLNASNNLSKVGSNLLIGGAAIGAKADRAQKYAGALSKMISGAPEDYMADPEIPSYYKFVSAIRQEGLARKNNFTVEFIVPKYASFESDKSLKIPGTTMTIPAAPGDTRNTVLMCTSVQMPGVNIASKGVINTGPATEMPSQGRTYGSVTTTFYVDSRFKDKAMFDRWMEIIQNPVTKNFSFYDDFISPMVIGVFDRNGDLKYRVDLMEAWPKTIGDISLSNEARDIMTFDVTWSYSRWTSTPVPALSEVSLSEKLRGYAGTMLDVQNTVNEVAGAASRALDMAGAGDGGGMAGQSYGGF